MNIFNLPVNISILVADASLKFKNKSVEKSNFHQMYGTNKHLLMDSLSSVSKFKATSQRRQICDNLIPLVCFLQETLKSEAMFPFLVAKIVSFYWRSNGHTLRFKIVQLTPYSYL